MQYIGVSSPVWTFPDHQHKISHKAANAMSERREYQHTIGPDTYATDSGKKQKHGYTFAHFPRWQETATNGKPGMPQTSRIKRTSFKLEKRSKSLRLHALDQIQKQAFFTTAKRTFPEIDIRDNPAPTAYDPEAVALKSRAPKYTFGYAADRSQAETEMAAVGPGAYDPVVSYKVKGGAFAPKRKLITPPTVRLPASSVRQLPAVDLTDYWSFLRKKSSDTRKTFAKAPRNSALLIGDSQTPGPALYDTRTNINPQHSTQPKGFSLGGRLPLQTPSSKLQTPEFRYNIDRDFFRSGRSYSFSKATREQPKIKPKDIKTADYERDFSVNSGDQQPPLNSPKLPYRVRGGTIGTSLRTTNLPTSNPGPCDYENCFSIIAKNHPKTIFGRSVYVKKLHPKEPENSQKTTPKQLNYNAIDKATKYGTFGLAARADPVPKDHSDKFYNIGENTTNARTGISFAHAFRFPPRPAGPLEIGPGFYNLKPTIPQPQPWVKVQPRFDFA